MGKEKMLTDRTKDCVLSVIYYGLFIAFGLSLLLRQPLDNPPDEYNRYLIPKYIAANGALPNGYDGEIRIYGYGTSYAFHPILPYIFQGYAMRFAGMFTEDETVLLYAARGVNLLCGLLMAAAVLRLSRLWFPDRRFSWLFAFMVMFLPQNIFLHTYVNTDSCCMLSTALILYGMTLGWKTDFGPGALALLSLGMILCILSYYNAYGYIVSGILLFAAYFYKKNKRDFLMKGGIVFALVFLGAGWWFIRNAVLYDGDFLGFRAREICASMYAAPEYLPGVRTTWQNSGASVWDMLTGSDFIVTSIQSFIGVFGRMSIVTSIWVYRLYKGIFLLGTAACALLQGKWRRGGKKTPVFWHINMIFCILMPLILSIIYSYAIDYQPQGRYILPSLIPLCAYCVHGLEKAWGLFGGVPSAEASVSRGGKAGRALTVCTAAVCLMMLYAAAVTVYGYALPQYRIFQ